ncbi:hypothetical protein RhiJN_00276 [Ceratobasidium sp. AG-Ba]|nr:hypothetical protein RhiJN_00276 [Ceratobasidium sp. AG-Ba]
MKACPTMLKSHQRSAICDSIMVSKLFACIAAHMRQGEGKFGSSANILERKFRDGIEIYFGKEEGWYREGWYLMDGANFALVDALLQVRDAVGTYCNDSSLAESYDLEDFSGNGPLYERFRKAGIAFPLEPEKGFDCEDWRVPRASMADLIFDVVRSQIWGLQMICSLHSLAQFEGRLKQAVLPSFPCAMVHAAQGCYDRYRHTYCPGEWLEPDEHGIPATWGADMNYYWALFLQNKKEEEFIANFLAQLKKSAEESGSEQVPFFTMDPTAPGNLVWLNQEPLQLPTPPDEDEEIANWRQRVHFADMSTQNEESEEELSDDEFSLPPSPPAIPPGLKDKILVIETEDEWELDDGYDSL